MAIQVRRGLKKDFIPEKLLPGEWAVSIDSETENQIVWMCFAPGVTKRMGTYEDFRKQIEEISDGLLDDYKAELNVIKSAVETMANEVTTDKDAVVTIKSDIDVIVAQMQKLATDTQEFAKNASDNAELSSDFATMSESFTHGGTGKREGEDTDNAKYYMEQAKSAVGGDFVSHDEVGKPNGVASLDASGKVPEEQIPMSKVDVDTELSEESENPVQNKVITAEISKLNSDLLSLEGRQGVSNPNLLDNAWFTINSRGQNYYTKYGYTVDRWFNDSYSNAVTFTVNDGIDMNITSSEKKGWFVQRFKYPAGLYTLSVDVKDYSTDKIFIINIKLANNTYKNLRIKNIGINYLTFYADQEIISLVVETGPSSYINFRSMKLEFGSVSTLHLDSAPKYSEEYIRCITSTADPTDEYANGYNPLVSDAWVQRTWTAGEICISDNKLWECLINNSNKPSEGTEWKRTSVTEKLKVRIKRITGTTDSSGNISTGLKVNNCMPLFIKTADTNNYLIDCKVNRNGIIYARCYDGWTTTSNILNNTNVTLDLYYMRLTGVSE